MGKYNNQKLIDIFNNTIELVEKGNTNSFTQKFNFDDIVIPNKVNEGKVIVIPGDTLSVAIKQSGDTCILNMASPKHAGGGVKRGSRAQEESLFRSTSLYNTVVQNFYPLKVDEALYSTDVIVVKDKNYVPLQKPYPIVDCVTIAAFKLKNEGDIPNNYVNIMKQKMRLMLSLAYKYGMDNIILGAWGCGVYNNTPIEVAKMFYEVLVTENYRHLFKKVIFAVINDHNSVSDNLKIFNDTLNIDEN